MGYITQPSGSRGDIQPISQITTEENIHVEGKTQEETKIETHKTTLPKDSDTSVANNSDLIINNHAQPGT